MKLIYYHEFKKRFILFVKDEVIVKKFSNDDPILDKYSFKIGTMFSEWLSDNHYKNSMYWRCSEISENALHIWWQRR